MFSGIFGADRRAGKSLNAQILGLGSGVLPGDCQPYLTRVTRIAFMRNEGITGNYIFCHVKEELRMLMSCGFCGGAAVKWIGQRENLSIWRRWTFLTRNFGSSAAELP